MQGLEDLLKGMPQQTSDGAILLALFAWHLYPDMIVLRNKPQKVKFSDTLFPPTGVITVGLESIDPTFDQGIKWSLTLSHLRYYSDPVIVEVQEDNSRVSMEQLRIVGLGAFLGAWGVVIVACLPACLLAYMLTPDRRTSTSSDLSVLGRAHVAPHDNS